MARSMLYIQHMLYSSIHEDVLISLNPWTKSEMAVVLHISIAG